MKKSSSFINQSLIYGLGLALNYGVGFLLLPVYSRMMPTDDYGKLDILNRTIEIISLLLLTQFSITYLRFFRDKPDTDYRRRVTSTCIYVVVIVASLIAIIPLVLSGWLSNIMFHSRNYSWHFMLIAFRYVANMAFIVPVFYFQATEQPVKFIAVSFSSFTTTVLLNITLLTIMPDKIAAVIWAGIIGTCAHLATVGAVIFVRSGMRFDWEIAKGIAKFTWSFTFLGLFGYVMNYGDRFFINGYCSAAAVGLYAAGYRIAQALNTFVFSPLIRTWHARMVDVIRQPDGTSRLARLTTYAYLLYMIVGVTVAIYSREIISIVLDRTYYACYLIVPIVVLAYGFDGLSMFMDTGIYYTKRTYLKIWHAVTTSACLALYFILIPKYCMFGAAWATLATYLIFVGMTWYLNVYVLPTKFQLGKLLRITSVGIAVYLLNYFFESYESSHFEALRAGMQMSYPWGYLAAIGLVKAPLVLIFIWSIKVMRIVEQQDLLRLWEIYHSLRNKIRILPDLR